ncbi:MAG TPA: iron ABC transporter permease, partial [Phycisphaerae bacterium]|nr:iron ABC transporter permease [Phycisphaerae bacterium]
MSPLTWRSLFVRLLPWALLLAIVLAISPGIGTQDIGVVDAWRALRAPSDASNPTAGIAWEIRFPRTLKALVAGVTLALAGAIFQTLFRNPLATPYTMGIASGASLGALIAYKIGWLHVVAGLSTVSLAAFIGALVVLGVVLLLARSSARLSGQTLLLAGVTIGFFCSGMMIFVTSLADVTQTYLTVRWMMGSLDTFGGVELTALLPIVVPAWIIMLLLARGLNQFAVGAEIAATRGVNVARLEVIGILVGSLAVAAVVSLCGPIGFVGLIIPHLARLINGGDHRALLPTAALLGGVFLIVCDFLTTLLPMGYAALSGREVTVARLPIGVMTALIGTPVFLV